MSVPPNKSMLRPVGFVLGHTKREREEFVRYETVNPYVEQCTRWKLKHPGACWILEQHSNNTWWVLSGQSDISPIKTFRSQKSAIEWLDTQGADWLTIEQYHELKKAQKRAAEKPDTAHACTGAGTSAAGGAGAQEKQS